MMCVDLICLLVKFKLILMSSDAFPLMLLLIDLARFGIQVVGLCGGDKGVVD